MCSIPFVERDALVCPQFASLLRTRSASRHGYLVERNFEFFIQDPGARAGDSFEAVVEVVAEVIELITRDQGRLRETVEQRGPHNFVMGRQRGE